MVLDPIPQSLPVHFFGSRPQPPTSRQEQPEGVYIYICIYICIIHMLGLYIYGCIYILYTYRTYVYYKYIMDHLFLSTLFCTSRLRAPRGGLALMYSLDVYTSKKKWVLIDLFFSVEWYFHCCTVVAQNSVNIYIYICVEASESVWLIRKTPENTHTPTHAHTHTYIHGVLIIHIRMCVYIYIYMRTYIHVSIYRSLYIYSYVYTYMYIYIHICICIYIHTRIYMYKLICICMYTTTYINVYAYTYIYIYIRIHTYIFIYIYRANRASSKATRLFHMQ